MKRLAFLLVVCAALLAVGAPAHANTACFDWSCDETTRICSFDAGCTTFTQGSLWRYRWDFGDGSSIVLTGQDEITHEYDNLCWANVELTVIPFSADNFEVTCEIIIRNCVGPPVLSTSGRCSA